MVLSLEKPPGGLLVFAGKFEWPQNRKFFLGKIFSRGRYPKSFNSPRFPTPFSFLLVDEFMLENWGMGFNFRKGKKGFSPLLGKGAPF